MNAQSFVTDFIATYGPAAIIVGLRVIAVLIGLWIAFRIARWLQRRLSEGLINRGLDQGLALFFGSFVRWALIAGTVLASLGVFGIETTSFAAMIGAAGFAVGLAFQGTLSNFSSGVLLLTFRPFTIGDSIVVAGVSGSVVEIGLFVTVIDTADNRRIFVPNSTVAGGVIENRSANALRRVDLDVNVPGTADLDKTRELLRDAAKTVQPQEPSRAPEVALQALGDPVKWQIRVWSKHEDHAAVLEALTYAVKIRLDRHQS